MMMSVIGTNRNDSDFQHIIFDLKGISWNKFCDKVIKCEEYIDDIVNSSIPFGTTTISKFKGAVTKIQIHDDIHIRVQYQNGDIMEFYKVEEGVYNEKVV